jgi:hypothetical protein
MIRGASPRRVTGMVQKSLIASRSFQPGLKTTDSFISAIRTTRIWMISHVAQGDTEIVAFSKIIED